MHAYFTLEDKFIQAQQLAASLIELAASRGVNKDKLLRGTGIFYEDLSSDTLLISADQLLKLISKTRQLMAGNATSFLLGQRLFPSNYGAISEALFYAKNLLDCIHILNSYRCEIAPLLCTNLVWTKHECIIQFKDAIGCDENFQFLLELYCTAIHSSLRYLSNRRVNVAYDFEFSQPRYIQEYEENLGFKINFNRSTNQIRLARQELVALLPNYSQVKRDHALHKLAQQSRYQFGFRERVIQLIANNSQLNQADIAEQLGISNATFKRRLKQHGTRFLALQDEYHRQRVLSIHCDIQRSNEDLASRLGFNDVANFRRAFKRWFGLTPSQFKQKFRHG
ncbi:AraC family transcriptional regulator [Catenovulum maritimum]|uniref:AraC family transcriptional regulator n=1 Tax=Catenovulum maritimum TaxID=1513271 RepID=UPI000660AB90|nr:AraC family transcriptional regulator ligand-binding domain-containing protein [Catenovulum maritimum]